MSRGGSRILLCTARGRGPTHPVAAASYNVPGYAIASEQIGLHLAAGLIGTVRIRITPARGTGPAFAGIAPAAAAARYLVGADYATVRGAAGDRGT